MEWRTFNQRIILLVLLSLMVVGLIAAGLEPYLALAIAAGIVMLLRDAWLPDGGVIKKAAGNRARSELPSAAAKPGDADENNVEGSKRADEGDDTDFESGAE
ncbi:hypothetical protein [Streptomyces sp. NPDC004763]